MNLGAPRAALFLSRARRSLTPPKHRSILLRMSTVQEIEAAADLLPVEQKEELLRFLAVRLRKERQQSQPRIYSNQEVATMVAEDQADGERLVGRIIRDAPIQRLKPKSPYRPMGTISPT